MNLTAYRANSLVELVPALPPLAEALTEEQHQQELDEQQRQVSGADCASSSGQLVMVLHCASRGRCTDAVRAQDVNGL
jgi:hypothetical protein